MKPISYLSVIIVMLLSVSINAQDLSLRIPKNAYAVVRLSGNEFFKHTTPAKINQSYLGKEILRMGTKSDKEKLKSIEDFGFDLNADAYIFFERNDSISYTNIIAPLKNALKMDAYFSRQPNGFTKEGNRRIYRRKDEEKTVIWDDKTICLVEGKENYFFFNKDEVAKRYGIIKPYYDSVTVAVDSVYSAPDSAIAIVTDPPANVDEVNSDTTAAEEVPTEAGAATDQYYDSVYYANRQIKQDLINAWVYNKAHVFFNAPLDSSILHNASYATSMRTRTVMDLWLNNLSSLYTPFMPIGKAMGMPANYAYMGYGALQAHVNMDKNNIEAIMTAELNDDRLDNYKKIYQHKLNPKLLDYVDVNNALGYMTYSIDTKSYLDLFPQYISDAMGMYGYGDKELGNISADFISLLIDEEAIAKVAKGDMVMTINGITTRTVNYTDYDYDENYNPVKVQKTREESIPDYLIMFSSDDTRLLDKLLAYSVKKDYAILDGGIHKLVGTHEFVGTGILVKDGIVLIGNDMKRLRQIQSDNYKSNISATQRAFLSNVNAYGFFNAKNVAAKMGASKAKKGSYEYRITQLLLNMGNVKFTVNGVQDNKLSASLIAEVPPNQQNPVDYILSLFELMDRKRK